MPQNSNRENREIPSASTLNNAAERTLKDEERFVNVSDGQTKTHAGGKSDGSIVPTTAANNDGTEPSAESNEGRDPAKRNAPQADLPRTLGRKRRKSTGLQRVREAARKDGQLKFTALLHHVNEDCLTEAFFNLKKTAAVGIDEVTWREYEQNLEANIVDLHDRIHRGAYRAKPSKRIWIPKQDGRQRPIGIASLEDKVVQQAVLWVLQAIYEQDFLGFSYGFRPGRSQHDALDALCVALTRKVSWVLDADIAGFFDSIDHEWLMKFLEHRIGDRRMLRLIRKWLTAGVSEDGEWSKTTVGTPQGAVISPLLANVFLHYVLDLWIDAWRKRRRGDIYVIRYADDFVICFENRRDAEACLEDLHQRLAKFGLKLHADKTRLLEFGRFAARNRARRGEGKPETFDFLGFTHRCGKTRTNGKFVVQRETIAKRMRATLKAIKLKLHKRRHWSLGDVGRWLRSVVQGWLQYYAVPFNFPRLNRFCQEVKRLWLRSIRRRSQRGGRGWTWERMLRLATKWLPLPRILHPHASDRFRARLKAGAV